MENLRKSGAHFVEIEYNRAINTFVNLLGRLIQPILRQLRRTYFMADVGTWDKIQQGVKEMERLLSKKQNNLAMIKARETLIN